MKSDLRGIQIRYAWNRFKPQNKIASLFEIKDSFFIAYTKVYYNFVLQKFD